MKNRMTQIAMKLVSSAAMICAVFIANSFCAVWSYQDELPEDIRSLRKF